MKPTALAIRHGRAALTEAVRAPSKTVPSIRVMKPLRSMVFGLVNAAADVAPSDTVEPFVGISIDVIDEALRRAAQAALLDGQHPAEAVRAVETTLVLVVRHCANQHAGGGQ